MSEYQLYSDGACDLPLDLAEKLNVRIVPFYISLDGETYQKELTELLLTTFYSKMIGEHLFPKTSLPSIQDYLEAFTPTLEEGKDVVCFTITDSLSGSVQSAVNAAQMLRESYPKRKIHIINSWNATGSQMLLVQEAVRMQKDGYSAETVCRVCEAMKKTARIFFMVDTLENLQKGGRIGKLASLSAMLLQVKPIIILSDGEISTAGIARGRKSALHKIIDVTKKHFETNRLDIKEYAFMIGTTNTPEEAPVLGAALQEALGNAVEYEPFQIGATIATHTGPNTVGICLVRKYEYFLP